MKRERERERERERIVVTCYENTEIRILRETQGLERNMKKYNKIASDSWPKNN